MNDLMLDIETLGTRPTSVICQLGACYFHRNTGEVGDTFCININVGSGIMAGLTVDEDTCSWWRQQKQKTWIENAVNIQLAFTKFEEFAKDAKFVWSHATFDVPIVANAYAILNRKLPFKFRGARDIRTLVDLANVKIQKDTVKTHDALDDCIRQVEYCVECFNKLRKE